MRDRSNHCPNFSNSVALFGGGMKKGFLYGKTADECPLVAVENRVTTTDLHATIMTAIAIRPTPYSKSPLHCAISTWNCSKSSISTKANSVVAKRIWAC
ncbi:MAG TPA: hypothetical protein DIV79_16335 [Opitutae bacterium]|nr:hypothetical protein [Opitutaceae bacterium]HCR31573.1 hypothetical protein [Opitutae bacterium]